jgi:hypothetical protein
VLNQYTWALGHRYTSLTKYSSAPGDRSQQKLVAIWGSAWNVVLFVRLLPQDCNTYTQGLNHAVFVRLWRLIQLSAASTGPPFHPIYNWIRKTPLLPAPLLASHVLGQTWTLFISQCSISASTHFSPRTFLFDVSFSFSYPLSDYVVSAQLSVCVCWP